VVTYADNSYVIVAGTCIEELKDSVNNISKKHVAFLKSMGMVVNPEKTEVVVFGKTPIVAPFSIDGIMVNSGLQMKALGLTIQPNLKWNLHLENIKKRIQPKLSMLKKIRKNLDLSQFLKLATSQLFSQMYYASQVWMNETLGSEGWRKLRSMHYRILRAAVRDFKCEIPRKDLGKTCKRVPPEIWSAYSTSSLVIKIKRDGSPTYLHEVINETIYTTRRQPERAKFYDNSRGKVGKHRLGNRLAKMNDLPPWLEQPMTDDGLRVFLRKSLNFDME